MRVALVHYHLQSGGVTRIICHLQRALNQRGVKTVVLTGKPPSLQGDGDFQVIPGLQYEADRPAISPSDLAVQMRTEATAALGGPPDLWHVHNHSLGKSLVLPITLRLLADQGERILFQIHDFAEDGRPANYRAMLATMAEGQREVLSRLLYPRAGHLHYAVLNSRDFDSLEAAGLDAGHLHFLLNPVDLGPLPVEISPTANAAPLWLYPTRAIRRKNLGEFLLWAAMAPQGTRFATTSGPENPLEQPRYRRWRQVATDLGLPVQFELVGPGGYSFIELLQRADVAVTTSVAEGFGMAFLEPWLFGTPVCGRNLPEIMSSSGDEGIQLPWSYDRLDVPLEWLGRDRVEAAAREGLLRNLAAYGRKPGKDDLERLLTAWICEDRVDFGRLDETLQEAVLRRLVSSGGQAALLRPDTLPDAVNLHAPLVENRRILRSRYTLERYGEAVEAVYQQVANSAITVPGNLDGEVLLDRFLAPERLCLLRVE
ncbi:glycosyltransferase [uncultured Desulfobulbus sp.]|uniref:glycosyltransferase n=1 Tax=uncultured Desulfobulbus sp. TaxID=239745 RepID=UPI0029C7A514|nr:glycosyltransferase [uncultured Desulfobulbus sp.]